MFPFLKGAVGGAVFAAAISAVMVHTGANGSWLSVREYTVVGHPLAWSWTLFIGGTGIASWAFLLTG